LATAEGGDDPSLTGEADASAVRFFFVGEALALDLVNTEVVVRGKPRDLLDGPGGYADWWQAALAHYPDAAVAVAPATTADAPALPAAAKELRAALRRILGAVADGEPVDPGDLAVLNRILASGYEVVEIGVAGEPRAVRRSRAAGPEAALLPVALSALELLVAREPARLHRCGNDRCVLLFYDTTKSATRRWCSTGCMNRARSARRYRARKRLPEMPGGGAEGNR